jgi:Phage derived protein Gp49-like (DUF891)
MDKTEKTLAKSFVAFEGPEFTVEWFYNDKGKSQALEYFEKLSKIEKVKTLRLFELIATEGKILNIQKFRSEGDGIYAFKPKPHRFMCFFFCGKKIIVTNAFIKKKDDLPPEEKKRALKLRKDYEERIKSEEYYE